MKKKIIFGCSLLLLLVTIGIFTSAIILKDNDKDVSLNNSENAPIKDESKENNNNEVISEPEQPNQEEKEVEPPKENSVTKKEENSNISNKINTPSKNEVKKPTTNQSSQENTSTPLPKEEDQKQPDESKVEETSTTDNVRKPEVISFYASITNGKKEFASESEALARGLEIATNELNYVIDYNEKHPDAPIQVDINYYRVYPSVIDENGKTWYYLHFFCQSGNNNDEKLKKMY